MCITKWNKFRLYIYPQRSCSQGDPISPYQFLLCAEIPGISIRNNKYTRGIRLADEEYKLSQNADDTSLISDGSPGSIGFFRKHLWSY